MGFLPEDDVRYLRNKKFEYREVQNGSQKGLIIKGFALPEERYDVPNADLLILIPSGYPDVPPDMFYLLPWVHLVGKSGWPPKADQAVEFDGQRWQRWSRHSREWRPGTDGIWTMLKRVVTALEAAA